MKERLISFTDDMQQESRAGRKTQARRVVELKYYDYLQFNTDGVWQFEDEYGDIHDAITKCPYGVVGDRLRSGDLLLEITGLRVERLQVITVNDSIAEGIVDKDCTNAGWVIDKCTQRVIDTWDSIYAEKHPWKSNPFVWVIEFKRIDK